MDKEKMKEVRWVKPEIVVEKAFNERTARPLAARAVCSATARQATDESVQAEGKSNPPSMCCRRVAE